MIKPQHLRFLRNTPQENHLQFLTKSLNECQSAYLALAYIKREGLALVRDAIAEAVAKKPITFVIGLPYYNTHPDALESLCELVETSRAGAVYVVDLGKWTFHCKFFEFVYANYIEVLVGSGNLTLGGLVNNYEISTVARISPATKSHAEIGDLKDEILALSVPASRTVLQEYQRRFEAFQDDQGRV